VLRWSDPCPRPPAAVGAVFEAVKSARYASAIPEAEIVMNKHHGVARTIPCYLANSKDSSVRIVMMLSTLLPLTHRRQRSSFLAITFEY